MQTSFALGLLLPAFLAAATPIATQELATRQDDPVECDFLAPFDLGQFYTVKWDQSPDTAEKRYRRAFTQSANGIKIQFDLTMADDEGNGPYHVVVTANGVPTDLQAYYRLTKTGPFVKIPATSDGPKGAAKCKRSPATISVKDGDDDVVLVHLFNVA